jgi:hypothetical protein
MPSPTPDQIENVYALLRQQRTEQNARDRQIQAPSIFARAFPILVGVMVLCVFVIQIKVVWVQWLTLVVLALSAIAVAVITVRSIWRELNMDAIARLEDAQTHAQQVALNAQALANQTDLHSLQFVKTALTEVNTQAIHRHAIFLGPLETFGLIPLAAGGFAAVVGIAQQLKEGTSSLMGFVTPSWLLFAASAVTVLYALLLPYRMAITQTRREEFVLEVAIQLLKPA